ncbi:hypothetical protein [Antrihabitans sp. YC2-6]|uniref:hypothetical protein n=1 Tax=Antrihabitans sp. YC2-6 TaxID=2799498 RepID=UPI0018F5F77E|nr:hypothetical protein [Antrihabitans sp. YC2-6]MBJ8346163.1 hypothetical protein [Antrihabitans sp. YC2-6]
MTRTPAISGRTLAISAAAALSIMVILGIPELTMQRLGAGILDFELARTPETAARILADWGDEGRQAVLWSLWGDFAFIVAYTTFAVLACLTVRNALATTRPQFARLGQIFASGAVIAAAADCIENANLLAIVYDGPDSPYPQVAFGAAVVKFTLIGAALGYALIGGGLVLAARRRRLLAQKNSPPD